MGAAKGYSDFVGKRIECRVGVLDLCRKMLTDYLRSALHAKLPKGQQYGILCKWDTVQAVGDGDIIKISGRLVKVEADC
jgi:hypothetical protein